MLTWTHSLEGFPTPLLSRLGSLQDEGRRHFDPAAGECPCQRALGFVAVLTWFGRVEDYSLRVQGFAVVKAKKAHTLQEDNY